MAPVSHEARDVLVVLNVPRSLAPPPSHVLATLRQAAARASSHLTILLPALHDITSPASLFQPLQRLLSIVYTECAKELARRELLLLPVDVILEDLLIRCGGSPLDRTGYAHTVQASYVDDEAEDEDVQPLYGTTAMGGTFDHLHSGHKILLTMAAWISERRVIVGMTDDALLGKKANRQLLEPLSQRTAAAHRFMSLIAPSLTIDTPALQDVYGPTAWDPDVQACVVSRESIKGAQAIDAERERKGLSKLRTFVIDVIAPDTDTDEPAERERLKMGSTAIRAWLAAHADAT